MAFSPDFVHNALRVRYLSRVLKLFSLCGLHEFLFATFHTGGSSVPTHHRGRRIKAFRTQQNMTQKRFGTSVGLSAALVVQMEKGDRRVTDEVLARIEEQHPGLRADRTAELESKLEEVLANPLLNEVTNEDIHQCAAAAPDVAEAMIHLHNQHKRALELVELLKAT